MHRSLALDFHVAAFCGEARKLLGEDSWTYGFCEDSGVIAVFDGCGGSGARKHDDYNNHSEAFMASRLCAGALYGLRARKAAEKCIMKETSALNG